MLDKPDPQEELNLLPNVRVGWEKKEQYLHWLAKVASEGHLTSDEWDKRRQYIENAQTEREIKVAFTDLPKPDFRKPPPPKKPWYEKSKVAVPLIGFLSVMDLESIAQGEWVLAIWFFLFLVYVTVNYYRGMGKK